MIDHKIYRLEDKSKKINWQKKEYEDKKNAYEKCINVALANINIRIHYICKFIRYINS